MFIIDDMYDVYGMFDELVILMELINRLVNIYYDINKIFDGGFFIY